jgi:hypothetical protein
MAEPLRLYDINLDRYREATQADLDLLLSVQRAYGLFRRTYGRLRTVLRHSQDTSTREAANVIHDELVADLKSPAPGNSPDPFGTAT